MASTNAGWEEPEKICVWRMTVAIATSRAENSRVYLERHSKISPKFFKTSQEAPSTHTRQPNGENSLQASNIRQDKDDAMGASAQFG